MNIYDIIKERVTIKDLMSRFESIELKPATGGRHVGGCFNCGRGESGRTKKFRAYDSYFLCFGCDVKGNLVDLTAQVNGWTKKEAFKWLIQNYASEHQYRSYEYRNYKEKKQASKKEKNENYILNSMLYGALVRHGKKLLFETKGEPTLDYLIKDRKYDREKIKTSDFFLMLPVTEAKSYLIKEFPSKKEYINRMLVKKEDGKEVKVGLSLSGAYQKVFPLGIPYRDDEGKISGLVYRSLHSKGETVKRFQKDSDTGKEIEETDVRYNSTGGLDKTSLFNIFNNKGEEEVLVVEGYPDATYLNTYNEVNICAIGNAAISDDHIESLAKAEVKRVVLSLDNDELKPEDERLSEREKFYKKRQRTINGLRKFYDNNIEIAVIDPADLGKKDIDERYREDKIEGVLEVLGKQKRGLDYLIFLINTGHRMIIASGLTDTDADRETIDKFFEFRDILGERFAPVFEKMFLRACKSKNITKKNIGIIECLKAGKEILSDEGIMVALDRLDSKTNKKLVPFYAAEDTAKQLVEKKVHPIMSVLFEENSVGKFNVGLNKKQTRQLNRMKRDKFLNSLSDRLISEIVLKTIDRKIVERHNFLLEQTSTVLISQADDLFRELAALSKMQKAINQ